MLVSGHEGYRQCPREVYRKSFLMGLPDIFGAKHFLNASWNYLKDEDASVEATHSSHRQYGVIDVERDIFLDGGFPWIAGFVERGICHGKHAKRTCLAR